MDRIAEALVPCLLGISGEELIIFVDRLGDDREAQLLRLARVAVDVESEALLGRVGQPFVDGDAIAFGLGDLLAILVEEHLVIEALGRAGAEDAGDLRALGDAVDQILARHLVIDAERDPAHRPIDLPLQLGAARQDRLLDPLALVLERDQPGLGVDHLDRHLQHLAARRADREDRRIGLAPFLAQRRQHHRHDRVVIAEAPPSAPRRTGPRRSSRRRRGIHNRSRTGRGTGAGCRYCDRHSSHGRNRTGPAPSTKADRDGRASCPDGARRAAPCASRPCRRRRRSAGSASRPSRRARGGPSGCAPPPGRCRDAAGPKARSRSRRRSRPRRARPDSASAACAPPHRARPWRQ